jgi:hypothetical protein
VSITPTAKKKNTTISPPARIIKNIGTVHSWLPVRLSGLYSIRMAPPTTEIEMPVIIRILSDFIHFFFVGMKLSACFE